MRLPSRYRDRILELWEAGKLALSGDRILTKIEEEIEKTGMAGNDAVRLSVYNRKSGSVMVLFIGRGTNRETHGYYITTKGAYQLNGNLREPLINARQVRECEALKEIIGKYDRPMGRKLMVQGSQNSSRFRHYNA